MNADMTSHFVKHVMHHALDHPPPRKTHPCEHAVVLRDGVGTHIWLNVMIEYIRLGVRGDATCANLNCYLSAREGLIN